MFNFCLNCMFSLRSFCVLLSFCFSYFQITYSIFEFLFGDQSLLHPHPYFWLSFPSIYILICPSIWSLLSATYFFFPFWLLDFTLFLYFYFFTFLLFYFFTFSLFLPFFIFLPQGDLKVLQEDSLLAQWGAYLHVLLCSLQVCY